MRRSGWANDAWALFQELKARSDENPEIESWVRSNESSFARTTRHPIPGTLADVAAYREKGGATGKRAWSIFEGWRKAGRWDKAAKWGQIGLEHHGQKWPWRGQRDAVAQAIMLSGDWKAASDAWDAALKARNGSKNLSLFYRSLTAHLGGEYERAEAGFTTLVTRGGRLEFPSRYWRIRTREAAGKRNTMADRTKIAAHDPTGWYKLLLQPPQPKGEGWVIRDGRWRGPALPELPVFEPTPAEAKAQVGIWPSAMPVVHAENGSRPGLDNPDQTANWGALKWPFSSVETVYEPPATKTVPTIDASMPDTYAPSSIHNPEEALDALRTLGHRAKSIWPELEDAVHLAQAGLYDESGPILRAAYDDYKNIMETGTEDEKTTLAELKLSSGLWARASRAGRDHHYAVRHLWGKKAEADQDAEAIKKLQFPVAYARELWPHCQRWDVDPFLILAIMRQESIYNPDALSPTGAIGLMQFIKGTGAKVSALLDEPLFSPHTLYNPSVNLRYSVYYFRLLNARFDGNFPIAVASYNGGPHHMSRAHRNTLGQLDLDAFVEMIPRREPRDYVKKVVGFYQLYVQLYGPEGAGVVLPTKLSSDDPEVVNF
jgi:soluble lytic murein transglycosylase-like protein